MLSMITAAMPSDLHDPFLQSDDYAGYSFVNELIHEFNSEVYPSWLAQLPETVQTYFLTRCIGAVLNPTDLLGSYSTVVTASVLTKGPGGVTSTVAGRAIFACVHRRILYPCGSR